ncbi:MAG: NDP-sugar synthase [Acidobacteria bacterium]|nr:NDP-sugar synthase [Acidobacteriota bacterium]
MRALVLTAGLGTRLRPLTYVRAKAAVPVNSEPLARRVIRWLCGHGISDLVLNLHHHPASIAAVVGDGADLGARVRYCWEQPVLSSAGGPRHALPLLGPDTFLLVNGDTLTDVDVPGMVAAHRASGAAVTMALIPNPRPEQYGGVTMRDGWVTGFTRPGASGPSYHFIGVQVVEPRVFASLPDGVPEETVRRVYPRLMADNPHAVAGFISDAAFQDIGTPRDYLDTSIAIAAVEGDRLGEAAGGERIEGDLLIRPL